MLGAMSALTEPLAIDIVSDVVCPWCYIGKRRLEAALAERGAGGRVNVRWHPFQLNPDLPRGGADRRSYLERKFGGAERAAEIYARVEAAGREAGIWFEFERIERQPNTLDAHRLLAWAQGLDAVKAMRLVEDLFRAYFTQGVDIGNIEQLSRLAAQAGFDAYAATAMLTSGEGRAAVAAADQRARAMGVTGVPLFIFNQRVAVSGAQPPKVLAEAMLQSEVATITR
jgi:predicted DsbA family dithiol-disulfide isomerase